jgi:hypothetical protein
MPKKEARILNTISIQATPVSLVDEVRDENNIVFQAYRLDMQVDGKQLLDPEMKLKALDGFELWLSQRFNRKSWPLTCTCGTPGCAGFWEPVTTTRRAGTISWAFHKDYFPYLAHQGLAKGRPRVITLNFDAKQFYAEFDKVLTTIRQYEEESGKASSFEAGSYAEPHDRLDQQLARAEAWHRRRVKAERYARHIGTPFGVCAGAPSGF